MKKLSSGIFSIAAVLLFSACGNDRSSTSDSTNSTTMSSDTASGHSNMADTTNMANNANGTMGTTGYMSGMPAVDLTGTQGGSNFVSHAASGSIMEVELARTAQQKASSQQVKNLAKMILDDHTKANAELKRLATGKNITVPTEMMAPHKSHMDMLNTRTGADFDRAYVDMMVQAHSHDIEMFRQASNQLTDSELKGFATRTLPKLQQHLDRAREVQTGLGGTGTGATGTGTGTGTGGSGTGTGTGGSGSGTGTGTGGSGTGTGGSGTGTGTGGTTPPGL